MPHRARARSAEILPPRPRCSPAASTGASAQDDLETSCARRSRRKGSRWV